MVKFIRFQDLLDNMKCPPEMQECLKVVFNLSKAESEVLYYICNNDCRITEMADDLEKDRSTVQRYVKKLCDYDLVQREGKTGESPGRHFEYTVKDKDLLKSRIKERLDEWRDERLEDLEEL